MKTIYKYPLEIKNINEIDLPEHSDILSVQMQNDTPCLWAMVNTDYPIEKRGIRIFGTGEKINPLEPLIFIDTFQFMGLVFHVFEIDKI